MDYVFSDWAMNNSSDATETELKKEDGTNQTNKQKRTLICINLWSILIHFEIIFEAFTMCVVNNFRFYL